MLFDRNLNGMERCFLKLQLLFSHLLIYRQIHHRVLLTFEDQQHQKHIVSDNFGEDTIHMIENEMDQTVLENTIIEHLQSE